MAAPLTAEDLLPLVKRLAPQERARLVRLITVSPDEDANIYRENPPKLEELSNADDVLSWDAEGWSGIG